MVNTNPFSGMQGRAKRKNGLPRGWVCLIVLTLVVTSTTEAAPVYSLLLDDNYATQPAINDAGEFIYVKDGKIVSSTRGVLVSGVDASNVGLSNSGEVVWADGSSNSRVTSTTRGVLTAARSLAPAIAATTGEVFYLSGPSGSDVYTSLQGLVFAFDPLVTYPLGVGDVNDLGEVVFEYRVLEQPFSRIFSTTRGFLTPEGSNAIQPSISNSGEVVYTGADSGGRSQIFSTVRGQLTFFDGDTSFSAADLPDIDSYGRVIFRGVASDVGGLYLIPEPSPIALVGIGLMSLILARRRTLVTRGDHRASVNPDGARSELRLA